MLFLESVILNEYLRFFIIFTGSIIVANITHFILKSYLKRKTEKTKKIVYKRLHKHLIKPLYSLIIFLGLYLALKSITIFGETTTHWLNNIFYIAFILITTILTTKLLTVIINSWLKAHKSLEKPPQIISKILTIIIYIIALLIILEHYNIETTPFLATLGLGALALGLALQNTLTNFFAGLHLISDKPVNIGDFVELNAGTSGHILDIGWRSTRLQTPQNSIIIVPNALLADSIITNNSSNAEKSLTEITVIIECGVAYESDIKKVEKVTKDVAKKIQKTIEGAVENFEPELRYTQFGESNIHFKIFLRAQDYTKKALLIHEFIKALKERFDKEAIEISYPVRKIIKEKHLSKEKE